MADTAPNVNGAPLSLETVVGSKPNVNFAAGAWLPVLLLVSATGVTLGALLKVNGDIVGLLLATGAVGTLVELAPNESDVAAAIGALEKVNGAGATDGALISVDNFGCGGTAAAVALKENVDCGGAALAVLMKENGVSAVAVGNLAVARGSVEVLVAFGNENVD